ncbi:MAG: peptidoglycan-binding protein [Lacrimispora saccharolytica]
MISNCGHDENGDYEYGQAGDQTGTEWEIKPWYRYGTSGWDVVLRFEDRSVAQMIADIARAAANNNLVGYDQKNRYSYWEHLQASNYDPAQITVACEADCSSGVVANVKAAGYRLGISKLKNVPIMYTVTSDLHYKLKSAGAIELRDSKYLTSDKYLRPGDILLAIGHHTATNLDMGSNASWDGSSGNVLSKGSTGADVKDMQTKLIACGYSCGSAGADGDFGEGTETALKNFQRDYNLVIDGIFGDASRAKLNEVYSSLMEDGFVKIKISTTSSTVRGIKVCGNQVPVCSKPGDSRTIVKHLNNGVLLDCDYRANTNGSCFYHYSEGWVDGKNLQGWVADNGRWWYLIGNGTLNYPRNQFYTVGNDTYYFDDDGWMVYNQWIEVGGKWYYTRSWGGILYNSFYDDGENIYYLKADGVMASAEWLQFDGKWYYFRDWGAAFRNELFTDPADGNIYYGHEDGSIATSEWIQLNGKWYYFRSWGAAYRNELFTDPADGNLYYGHEDGSMATSEWIQVGEDWYYFRDWGAALNIGLWSDGENTYYFGTDCKMKTGWITVGNTTYFFRDWGAMLKHAWIKTNGVWKYVDKNGVYVPSKDTTNQPDTSDGSIIYTGKV